MWSNDHITALAAEYSELLLGERSTGVNDARRRENLSISKAPSACNEGPIIAPKRGIMPPITRKSVYWRAIALVFVIAVTLTMVTASSGALATAKRGGTNPSIAYGSLRATSLAAWALPRSASRLDGGRTLKRSAANSTAYADPAGDCTSASAPTVPVTTCDIQSVNVSNDDDGLITFEIGIPGSPTLAEDMEIVVFIDSDQNAATGTSASGSDYAIDYWTNAADPAKPVFVALFKLSATGMTAVSPQPDSLEASYTSGAATLTIGAAALGSSSGLDFYARAYSGLTYDSTTGSPTNYDTAPSDDAPNTAMWRYKIVVPLSAARLAGTFAITYSDGYREKYQIKPICASGACNVTVKIPGLRKLKFSRSGVTYTGNIPRQRTRCSNGRIVPYSGRVRIKVSKAAWKSAIWRATAITGSYRLHQISCGKIAKWVTNTSSFKGKLK